jgi:ankyrin repeat protein
MIFIQKRTTHTLLLFINLLTFFYLSASFACDNQYQKDDQSQKHIKMILEKGVSYCPLAEKEIKWSNGNCFGFSSVWLYSKWLQFTYPEKYQGNWYEYTVKDILDHWSDCDNIRKFTLSVRKFQNSQSAGTFEKEMDQLGADGKKIQREYSIASLLTLSQLKQLLSENIIHDHTLVHVNVPYHATALFKDGSNYYYFNPNDPVGEYRTSSIDDVAVLIFKANGFDYIKPSPLALQIFSFDEKTQNYPSQQEILDRINPSLTCEDDYADKTTGLHQAASSDCLESINYFLHKGVDVDLVNERGFTALMFASLNGHQKVVRLLLDRGANHNLADKYGYTALMFASKNGHYEVVRLLLEKKANPNLASMAHYTALMVASQNGHYETVRLLLEKGANPDLADNDGYTAFMYAAKNGHYEVAQMLLEKMGIANITAEGSFA